MPFIRGGELYKILRYHRNFREPIIKFYITQIVIGVGKLHEKGIMHRDIKAENIMMCENGYLKLIDFGLAHKLKPGQVAQTVCGTVEYMAPEVLQEQDYGLWVDWWSVGILMYEMLFGVTPFFH